jgi:hypothetical protein
MPMMGNTPRVLKMGGGVETTGLVCGLIERNEPVDAILFADTGCEFPHTMENLDALDRLLAVHGFPTITRVRVMRNGAPLTLEAHSLATKKMPSVSYGRKSCSVKFKIEPSEAWLKTWPKAVDAWARGEPVTMMIGYNVDEVARYTKAPPPDARFAYDYPLVRWRWGREDCRNAAARFGLSPRKSSCFFCGSARPAEVRRTRAEYPDLFARALAVEANARPFEGSIRGLGKNFAWADIEEAAQRQGRMFDTIAGPATLGDFECECHEGGEDDD